MVLQCTYCGRKGYTHLPADDAAKLFCTCGKRFLVLPHDDCPDCTHKPCEGCEGELGAGDA